MGAILGSWSGMRKYLEKEMLADSLKRRVRYNCTSYVGMDGSHVFELIIDDRLHKRFSLETVNSYFIACGYCEKGIGIGDYWAHFWPLLEQHPINTRTEYTDEEFCKALELYRNQDIGLSIESENPLVRMFAILDRRVGKRTLMKLKDALNRQPLWLQKLYSLRFSAENN